MMTLNEHEIKELQTHYGKRFEPLLRSFVKELSELIAVDDRFGLGFLTQACTRLLGEAIRRLPDDQGETVH